MSASSVGATKAHRRSCAMEKGKSATALLDSAAPSDDDVALALLVVLLSRCGCTWRSERKTKLGGKTQTLMVSGTGGTRSMSPGMG